MKQVWKYVLSVGITGIKMPEGAKVLTAAMQGQSLCIWAEVNPKSNHERRVFGVYGTGCDIPDAPSVYIATVMMMGGDLVWHVYEHLEETP